MGNWEKEKLLEAKFWIIVWTRIIIGIIFIVITIVTYDYFKDHQYITAGYQKTVVLGPVGYQWNKVK